MVIIFLRCPSKCLIVRSNACIVGLGPFISDKKPVITPCLPEKCSCRILSITLKKVPTCESARVAIAPLVAAMNTFLFFMNILECINLLTTLFLPKRIFMACLSTNFMKPPCSLLIILTRVFSSSTKRMTKAFSFTSAFCPGVVWVIFPLKNSSTLLNKRPNMPAIVLSCITGGANLVGTCNSLLKPSCVKPRAANSAR